MRDSCVVMRWVSGCDGSFLTGGWLSWQGFPLFCVQVLPSVIYEVLFMNPCNIPQRMLHGLFANSQVLDIPALHYQGVGNHATMASPPQRLAAHDSYIALPGTMQFVCQVLQSG